MTNRIGLIWLLALLCVIGEGRAAVPLPSETPARIVVSGRTSTAVDIKIVKVGQEIPKTYAGGRIRNTPGFEFYVSEHYALKSSMDEAFSREMLELSELAYPHWVAMVGAAPPDPDTRMYMVYAQNGNQLRQAMISDIGTAPGGFLGGFTIYANRSAYNLPGGTLRYHRRGLVIHENLHALNMVCNGSGGGEGMTYCGEQHVYDPAKKQLTVFCFDKAPINNYTADGLAALRKQFIPMPEAVKKFWYGGGGVASVYHLFFFTDPDRFLKWQIWRDEFFYKNRVSNESNPAIMEDIFGSLDALNTQWEEWVKARRATFRHVDWGWEQDGSRIWAYGFPWDKKYWSQMDILHAPGENMAYDPLRMDYPAEPMPPTVGPVKRGVAEPSVGFVLSGVGGGCWGGFGLGVRGRSMCQVVIAGDKTLVIEGKDMAVERREFPLTEEVKAAAKRDGGRYGVTIRIGTNELAVTVRAGASGGIGASKPEAVKGMTVAAPIGAQVRERLVNDPMAMVGRNGYPAFIPFIDDDRKPAPDLTRPAPVNRWRFPAMDELETLYRAAWRLKREAPGSLLNLQRTMLAAVDQDAVEQARALSEYESRIEKVVADVRNCGADGQTKALALAELAGVEVNFAVRRHEMPWKIALDTRVRGRIPGVTGLVTLALEAEGTNTVVATHPLGTLTRRMQTFTDEPQVADTTRPLICRATVDLRWRGESVSMTLTQLVFNSSIPNWWTIGPFDNKGGGTVDTPQPVEQGGVGLGKTYTGAGGKTVGWSKAARPVGQGYFDDFVLDFAARYGGRNASAYAVTWLDSPKAQDAVLALGSDDGVVVWLNGKRVHSNLVARPYASKQDRVPIRLIAGRNELLVKVTQGEGGWAMGAQLLDKDGQPMPEVHQADNRGAE